MFDQLSEIIAIEGLLLFGRSVVLAILGLMLASLGARLTARALRHRLTPQMLQITRRLVFYGIFGIFAAAALAELGFSVGVIMGAAGVLTVAIGFASQTTASNLISGLFLIGERSFEIGDIIRVGDTIGEVLSIDALSVKLRTYDNLYVRLPNETLIKSEVTTLTRFPIRRLDLKLYVAYKEDIAHVHEVLSTVADANPLCLDEPPPLFILSGFGDSGLEIQYSVWTKRENFLPLRKVINAEIKSAFDAAGIEIPFPHRSLYTGEATQPFPIRLVDPPADPAASKTERKRHGKD